MDGLTYIKQLPNLLCIPLVVYKERYTIQSVSLVKNKLGRAYISDATYMYQGQSHWPFGSREVDF